MRWTLNRWTILAVILLLSTAVGLAFRPWGPAEGPPQTVENDGLSLTCPEYLKVAAGGRVEFSCEFRIASEYRVGHWAYGSERHALYDVMSRLSQMIDTGNGTYVYKRALKVAGSQYFPVVAGVRPDGGSWDDAIEVTNTIEVRARHNPVYYMGMGLFLLQALAVFAGMVLAPSEFAYAVLKPSSSASTKLRGALRSMASALFLASPRLYRVWRQRNRGESLDWPETAYSFVSILWWSYIIQHILFMVSYIVYSVNLENQTDWIFGPGFLLFFTIPIGIVALSILLVIRRCSFTRLLRSEWDDRRAQLKVRGGNSSSIRWVPIVAVVVTGWIYLPLVMLFWF